MEKWIRRFNGDTDFFKSPEAITLLKTLPPSANRQIKRTIPVLLMNLYLDGTESDRKVILTLLLIAGQRKLSFQGRCKTGLPVYIHVFQFRLSTLYSLVDLPSAPSLVSYINLSGYMGVLVKAATSLIEGGLQPETIISRRNTPFKIDGVLHQLQQKEHSKSGVLFADLVSSIAAQPMPQIRKVDAQVAYKIQNHKKLPQIQKTALHDAVLHYNHRLVVSLLDVGANPFAKDFWGRNFLHIAEIVGATETISYIQGLDGSVRTKLQNQKDGFGRTPIHIRKLKSQKSFVSPFSSSKTNGGWDDEELSSFRDERCDIDVVHYKNINFQRFSRDYISLLKPVLIRGGAKNMGLLRKAWEKNSFLQKCGRLKIETGEIPYADSFGLQSNRTTIKRFLQNPKEYAFCRIDSRSHRSMFTDFVHCGFFEKLVNLYFQFYLGKAGTGAPIHFHVDAWNALIHGKKRWFVFPPMQGMYSTMSIGDWLNGFHVQTKPLEFTQHAGDIVYIPRFWSHGVLNLKESVGFAAEFAHPYVS